MAKGYWIANNLVHDAKVYETYKIANAIPYAKFGAKFVIRGGQQQDRLASRFAGRICPYRQTPLQG